MYLGMHVLQADGRYGVITGYQLVPGSAVMYNLEVQQDHTFVVGSGEWVVHNCDFKTFYANNKFVFASDDEARAVYNTVNRANAGVKLWDVDGSIWNNWNNDIPGGRFKEWTVNFGDTVPWSNRQRGGLRILMGGDGSLWFTPSHYGDMNIPGRSDFYQLRWRGWLRH